MVKLSFFLLFANIVVKKLVIFSVAICLAISKIELKDSKVAISYLK